MIVPAYGPKWRYKVPRMSPFIWHIRSIHHYVFRPIRVAPWNVKPQRKKSKR